jgi:hypothetical protein
MMNPNHTDIKMVYLRSVFIWYFRFLFTTSLLQIERESYEDRAHRTIKWTDSSSSVDSCTSIYMSAQETQLTDGKYSSILTYPNYVRINQCYGFIVNIQRSMLTKFWSCASFTSHEFWLKITTLSDQMRHFYF